MYSVIIPARNEGVNLWYTLHCIRMIWDEWDADDDRELIVVDSASTDGTATFLAEPRIAGWVRRVATDRTGAGPARQVGAEVARGEILFFADAHVLFAPDFFRRACRIMRGRVWSHVGSFHFPLAWIGGYGPECATHYQLSLDRDFWGINVAGNFHRLTEIAAMGHGCFAVRRDHFFQVRGFAAPFVEYGGEETYLDLKFARFGYRNYCYPKLYYLHCSQRHQAYPWSGDMLLRNNLLSAFIVGGSTWADRLRDHALHQPGVNPSRVAQLYAEAVALGAEEHAWLNAQTPYSLDDVLADFRARGISH